MQEQKSPLEVEKDAIAAILAKAEAYFPEICQQARHILEKLEVEAQATPQEAYSILQQLRARLQRVSQAAEVKGQIEKKKAECGQHIEQLVRLGIDIPNISNWGLPIDRAKHQVKNVSRVVVDCPETHAGPVHDFIDYRVVFRCDVPTADSAGFYYACRKRFNDLKALRESLGALDFDVPELPPQRHWLLGGQNPFFIEERRQKMARFLTGVAAVPALANSAAFQDWALGAAQYRQVEQGIE